MQTDDEIVQRVLNGDTEAFASLVEIHEASVYAYARSRLGSPADAEELTQETFVEAYFSLMRYQRGTDFPAWVRAICRNLVRNHFRSLARRRESGFWETCLEMEGPSLPPELPLDVLRRCVDGLDEEGRRLVEGFYRRSLSLESIAEAAGISFSAAGVALHRARYKLRDCLKRAGVEGLA